MKKFSGNMFFEKIGGSFQFRAQCAADLRKIASLDPTAWAALCVPVSSLNGDPGFFAALDNDRNGMLRVDEVKSAVAWLLNILKDFSAVDRAEAAISLAMLNKDDADGKNLSDFIEAHKTELENSSGLLELDAVRAKISAVKNGALNGDGMLKSKAVTEPSALELYTAVTTAMDCPEKLTLDILEKFLSAAHSFTEWAKTTEKPCFRGDDPEKYYPAYQALAGKIDEFFRYCELICIDPAHRTRFELDPAKLPELDLLDKEKINSILKAAPLARPDAGMVLDLNAVNNPVFQKDAAQFSGIFKVTELSYDNWQELKAEFSAYELWLARTQNDPAGKLGIEKLEACLAGNQADILRKIFAEDKAVAGILDNLQKLESREV